MTPRATQTSFAVLCSIVFTGFAACAPAPPGDSRAAASKPANSTPAATATAEHPELGEAAAVTEDALTAAVSTYLQAESARQGGTLVVQDPGQPRPLNLTLATVHREGTRKLPDGRYFACAEFKERDGDTYDLDVFMRLDVNGLSSDEIMVHKQNGAPRYNWVHADGIWKREPVAPK